MIRIACLLVSLSLPLVCFSSPEDALKQYLKYVYGDSSVRADEALHANPDNWMIAGELNADTISLIEESEFIVSDPGVFNGAVGRDLIFVEFKDGKAEPGFMLEGIYSIHRQLILKFLYEALLQNDRALKRFVTNSDNINFGRVPAAPYGDMDVYAGILGLIPIVRSSDPTEDARKNSITYRLPLSQAGFELTLVKKGNSWKIDTSEEVILPMEFFWR